MPKMGVVARMVVVAKTLAVAKVLVAAKTGPTRHDTSDTTRHDLTPTPTGVVSAD